MKKNKLKLFLLSFLITISIYLKGQTPTLLDSNNTYIRNKCYEVTLGGSNCGTVENY